VVKRKSPNAALIESLKPAERIPYDPELMQVLAEADRREWDKFETLRCEVYRYVMPTIWADVWKAEQAGDVEEVKSLQMRADRQWAEVMGVPALTSFSNLKIVMATVLAAGYPATDAGLRAWTLAQLNSRRTPSTKTVKPPAMDRLKIDLARKTVSHDDGPPMDVASEQALRWRKVLADHPGNWISGPDLKQYDANLDSVRTDRLRTKLPDAIHALIDTDTGKGSRINLALA
jgi:hypothetical protein